MIIVGSSIIVYDYPQLEYLKNPEREKIEKPDRGLMVRYQRLQTEFAIGIGMLSGGILWMTYGIIKKDTRDSWAK